MLPFLLLLNWKLFESSSKPAVASWSFCIKNSPKQQSPSAFSLSPESVDDKMVPPCCLLYIICFIYLELGGGNSKIFYVHPQIWGRFPNWRAYFFQMGWFNHQPVNLLVFHPNHQEIGISGKTNPSVGCFCRFLAACVVAWRSMSFYPQDFNLANDQIYKNMEPSKANKMFSDPQPCELSDWTKLPKFRGCVMQWQELGCGFKYVFFSPQKGEDSDFDWYFSNGLVQPRNQRSLLKFTENFGRAMFTN